MIQCRGHASAVLWDLRWPDPPRGEERALETVDGVRGLSVMYVVMGGLMPLFPLPAVLDPTVPLGTRLAWYLPLVVVALFMIFRLSRVAVIATDRSVTVRNPLRTVEIPWSQVTAIDHGVGLLRKVAFRLHDGSVLAASALPTGGGGVDQPTRRIIDELEARRRAHVETS